MCDYNAYQPNWEHIHFKLNKLLAIDYNPEFINNLIKEYQKKYPEIYVVRSFKYFCENNVKVNIERYWPFNIPDI